MIRHRIHAFLACGRVGAEEQSPDGAVPGSRRHRGWTAAVLVLIAASFVLIGLDKVNESSGEPWFEDTQAFLHLGLFIKEHGGASSFLHVLLSGEYQAAVQKPLYPLLLSTFASNELVFLPRAQVLSLAMGLLVVVALFYICRDLCGDDVAYLGAGGLVLNVTFLRVSSHVQCETTLMLFMLLSLFCMMKGTRDDRYWIGAGIFGGLAYLTKGTGLILVPVFAVATLWIFGPRVVQKPRFWGFFLLFALICSPLITRNMMLYGEPAYESANSHALWLDHWDDIYLPKYQLVRQYPEVIWEGRALPTMQSYLASHSFSDIVMRASTGVWRESRLLLASLEPFVYIKGVGALVCLYCCMGLASEIRNPRVLYPVFFMAGIFVPFAWMNQSVPASRFIAVLVPLVYLYAAIGFTCALGFLDRTVFQQYLGVTTRRWLPALAGAFFVFISGYAVATQEVHWPRTPAALSPDFEEVSAWIGGTLHSQDLVLMSAGNPYIGYSWHVGLRGRIAVWTPEMPVFAEGGIPLFNWIVANTRAGPDRYVMIHKDDIPRLRFLSNYFTDDGFDGMRELRSPDGWKLVYASRRPTTFLIYRMDQAVVASEGIQGEAGVRVDR